VEPPTVTPRPYRGTERDYARYVTAHPPASRRRQLAATLRRRPLDAPVRPITRAEFDAVARTTPYYAHRWVYMSAAATVAGEVIRRHRVGSALELGPHVLPLIVGADVMDLREVPERRTTGRTVIADATVAPWPVPDRAYDLFVALQVFEHLGTSQAAVFREVRRVARHAIISLPIEWEMADPSNCHHRIAHDRALSWFAPIVPTRVELGNPGPKMRLLYVFEDLPLPE
jgi:hypothetical protein